MKNLLNRRACAWLLALVLMVSTFLSWSIPAQADEDANVMEPYVLSYISILDVGSYDYQYVFNFASAQEIFFYKQSDDCDYDTTGYRVYKIGYLDANGTCQYNIEDQDLNDDGTDDFGIFKYSFANYKKSDGSLYSEKSSDDATTCWGKRSYLFAFKVSSESDYDFSGNVFESIEDAQNFYDTGDNSGLIRGPGSGNSSNNGDVSDGDFTGDVSSGDIGSGIDQETLRKTISEAIQEFLGSPMEKLGSALQAIANSVVSGTESITSTLISARDYLVQQLPRGIGGALGWLFNKIDSSVDDVHDKLSEFYNYSKDKLKEIGDSLSGIAEGFGDFLTDFKDFSTKLFDGTFLQGISDTITNALSTITQPFRDLAVDLFVPDLSIVDTEMTKLESKLGFISDFKDAWQHIVDFLESIGTGKPPVIYVDLGASTYRDLGGQSVAIDFSWYAPYKPLVDKLIAGIVYITFIWNVFKRLPDILQGAGMCFAGSAESVNHAASSYDKSFSVLGRSSGIDSAIK